MLFARSDQVNVVVPFGLPDRQTIRVQVVHGGIPSNQVEIRRAAAAPAIFTQNASGEGLGAILNQDGSLNGTSRPARRGSVVAVFATGGGRVKPPGTDGRLNWLPLPVLEAPVHATVGGQDAEVLYAGPAPGLIAGALQVNLRIPETLAPGLHSVRLAIAGIDSPGGVLVNLE